MVEGKVSVGDILEGSLQTIHDRIKMLLDKFGTSAVIIQDAGHNNISSEIVFFREETDAEYTRRLETVRQVEEAAQARRQKEFIKLKKLATEHGMTLIPRRGRK